MEPEPIIDATEQTVDSNEPSVWHRITPFSKYAAMLLFIVMPFIGGWIGYHYAPEKMVEKTVIKEVEDRKDIGSDERNKLLIREALVQDILSQDDNTYDYVLDEPNGFNPYIYDPKARDLNINGLAFQSINKDRHLTTVEFGLNRFTDEPVKLSGTFELWFEVVVGRLVLRFVPDESALQTLPWSNTTP